MIYTRNYAKVETIDEVPPINDIAPRLVFIVQ